MLVGEGKVERASKIFIERIPWDLCYNFIVKELLMMIILHVKLTDHVHLVLLLRSFKEAGKPILTAAVTEIMDTLFEEISRSIERNDFKEAQRRISHIRFVAESYNYGLIHTDTLIEQLYRLINYDITRRRECPALKALDSSKIDGFRVRLVCSTLDYLGDYFAKGWRKTQMDRFLIFFQRYLLAKEYVLMDLEFALLDCFDKIRPAADFKKYQDAAEAAKACEQIEQFESEHFQTGVIVKEYQPS